MALLRNEPLKFTGQILDNVHGFIKYTETEERIMNTLLFKRLQSIKQLSIVNWVFPGSEHTRYTHSLGVMYISDRIAQQLELSLEDRKIVRLAGLLHDIGHYPLSHVCELPYKDVLEGFSAGNYCHAINEAVKREINELNDGMTYKYMKKSAGLHHENIGAYIILNNKEIRDLIINECGEKAPEIISDMITGNVDRANPLLVQILHSEVDADGIDYLMRDSLFSGTSFGTFELDQLIGSMCIGEKNGKQILCISPKGIPAADQYLINKFFSYSQVVFNKHVLNVEWMAEQVVRWMQRTNAYFPKAEELKNWVCSPNAMIEYLNFTDNLFWGSLQRILSNELIETVPEFIRLFSESLLHHNELKYVLGTEIKTVSCDSKTIQRELEKSILFSDKQAIDNKIAILALRKMSKQVPINTFCEQINYQMMQDVEQNGMGESNLSDKKDEYETRLYMECVCIKEDDGTIHLLCDDKTSLMQNMYNLTLGVLRMYEYKSSG